ncbi:hypothetical protein [Candidatus Halobonum tyrrellensis]|uniref:Uncharacterized protein n=1 Tax=Candidatus Halobonum tyrrellensis G22 TaxID=1324957 RepID=V4GSS0_9EURY|nr:hypothetical protein [Candidatus Halobonum tyrrellensis]ESP88141.1 hypothetical protein K933_10637 [Candidatus Halobonum tyrrellensis G22]
MTGARRSTLAAALLAGKGFDAVSTVVVLSLSDSVREAVPLSRALMAAFGPVGGMVVLTVLTLVAFGLLAEAGVLVERRWPDETPDWYAPTLRAGVYLGPAVWFALVGVRNFTHLL